MKKIILFTTTVLLLTNCSTTTNKQDKSYASRLNGNNVSVHTVVGGIIPISTKHKNTSISGRAITKKGDNILPVRFCEVALIQKDVEITSAKCDHEGKFTLNGKIDDGPYQLKITNQTKNNQTKNIRVEGFDISLGELLVF
ncbi:MAG: hypothetical protein A2504_10155 [Bdellovibrionales bacterium RIFOXYD12_FULL_39_22]|nr:MAG: hypothetical protein A2385_17790 [Bdellovibrionales bacterium RIFOXYB1_FULL_39_21]OFZ43972.1 MAG: hypothetical protein A2485_04460 [Bdellovibrionales bacterium RIFOXYC12_FULL_39_17]OFZ48344.1 MAG: hypothetical protein A2404_01875 [Bdellovibrionales bacterium RIFOXYC1_FULL_39_130]OFZ71838.1 MAG: hypothetical protein A2451_12770 [Bdellovibrionales bacterium RIFOXYC2_FULL_39_8]OFZ76649.1 MAG: hypothetical protein A2560_17470 [Bdellovibrionales bacterium RIFOXYD1_FULL_39_84]OFZ94935.1 MAG: